MFQCELSLDFGTLRNISLFQHSQSSHSPVTPPSDKTLPQSHLTSAHSGAQLGLPELNLGDFGIPSCSLAGLSPGSELENHHFQQKEQGTAKGKDGTSG